MCKQRRQKNFPKKPSKRKPLLKAREILLLSGAKKFPINPNIIYDLHENWNLLTYKEAKAVLEVNDPLNLKKLRADARTIYDSSTDTYLTVYNESIFPASRIRWTIAHEIGHIVLGHLEYSETAYRENLTTKKYKVLEKEANFFAAELLAPLPILKKLGVQTAKQIKQLCHLSNWAADNRENDLKSTWWNTYSRYVSFDIPDEDLFYQLENFLSPITLCIDPTTWAKSKLSVNEESVNLSEVLSSITIDTKGRFTPCPGCGNQDFSDHAQFCKMCGVCLVKERADHLTENHCGKLNPSDACYCEHCGSRTFLTYKGLFELSNKRLGASKQMIAG